jgi:hypothetical protein
LEPYPGLVARPSSETARELMLHWMTQTPFQIWLIF